MKILKLSFTRFLIVNLMFSGLATSKQLHGKQLMRMLDVTMHRINPTEQQKQKYTQLKTMLNTLAQNNNQYPKLFLRDSSSTIVGKNLGTGNTSREFIYYTGQKQQVN